ncbi:MAG: HAMP domain-containing sensor histidine kinase [Eubacteriales bacterium]|nr:HAMP domain-containing sensor histidine kinase [Eubacteriales bacterium]
MFIRNGELVIILGVKQYLKLKFFKSLRFYLILLLMIVGIIPSVIMKAMVLENYEKRAVDVRTAEIQNQCTVLCEQLINSHYQEQGISEIIRKELIQLSDIYNGRIMVIDDEMRVIFDTYYSEVGKYIVSGDVVKSYRGQVVSQYNSEKKYIEIALPIEDKDEGIGVMVVSVSTDAIAATMTLLNKKVNIFQIVLILIVIVLAIILGSIMVRPFEKITRTISNLTEGYDEDLDVYTYEETALISDAFNRMIRKQRTLDKSRQEFVSNVSHELKTPLTAMKVLSDSLLMQEDVPVELYKEFMQDLSGEIERENKIINDLLELVKMDKTAASLNVRSENINELVEQTLKRLQPIAAASNIEVLFKSYRPVTAEVDEVKLSLALINLVENAIKYNKENGWVHVTLNADHKNFFIEIADSGIGISQEDTEHIFERFYRVDKSHSREIGGTGLGLSIARNIIVMHRGAIKVFSQLGEGTTFSVRIPVNYVA